MAEEETPMTEEEQRMIDDIIIEENMVKEETPMTEDAKRQLVNKRKTIMENLERIFKGEEKKDKLFTAVKNMNEPENNMITATNKVKGQEKITELLKTYDNMIKFTTADKEFGDDELKNLIVDESLDAFSKKTDMKMEETDQEGGRRRRVRHKSKKKSNRRRRRKSAKKSRKSRKGRKGRKSRRTRRRRRR